MSIEEKRVKIQKWTTVGIIGLLGLIVSPVFFQSEEAFLFFKLKWS